MWTESLRLHLLLGFTPANRPLENGARGCSRAPPEINVLLRVCGSFDFRLICHTTLAGTSRRPLRHCYPLGPPYCRRAIAVASCLGGRGVALVRLRRGRVYCRRCCRANRLPNAAEYLVSSVSKVRGCCTDFYWHASHVGSVIRHIFGSASATVALVEASEPAAAPWCAPDDDTAFSSPPRPVDFSADVAASVRR
jgi:hypothetical protein